MVNNTIEDSRDNHKKPCACGCGLLTSGKRDHGFYPLYRKGHNYKYKENPLISERQLGEKNHRWKGGRYINGAGYIEIRSVGHPRAAKCGFYVKEHVLKIEEYLSNSIGFKTYIDASFHINHKNHIRDDNRLENLQLMTGTEHSKLHTDEIKNMRTRYNELFAVVNLMCADALVG